MPERYSIAEARNNLPRLVHRLGQHRHFVLTRRGEPVAVLMSLERYQMMLEERPDFWQAVQRFRAGNRLAEHGNDLADAFEDVRDPSPGRED